MKKLKQKISPEVLLLITSFCLCLALAEITLRVLRSPNPSNSSVLRVPHPVYGWSLQPYAHSTKNTDGRNVSVKYNSKGWRDTEHAIQKKPGVRRIVVLGDSYMEGYTVELRDSLPKVIEQVALEQSINLESINLGVGGYGTLQEYLVFRDAGKRYKPDIVLLGFYIGNDLVDNSLELQNIHKENSGVKSGRPFLRIEKLPDWEITTVNYEHSLNVYQDRLKKLEESGADSILGSWGTRSALIKIGSVALENLKYSAIHKLGYADKYFPSRKNQAILQYSADKLLTRVGMYYCNETNEYADSWRITRKIFERLAAEVQKADAQLIVFSVPARAEVESKLMKETIKRSVAGEKLCLENPIAYKRLSQMLKKLGIPYLNLLPEFKKFHNVSEKKLFYYGDSHWNEAGHQLASEKLFQFLKIQKLL